MKRPAITFIIVACLCLRGRTADTARAFSVDADSPFAFRLGGRVVALAPGPSSLADTRIVKESTGFSGFGERHRREVALFEDRLEYTYDYRFTGPVSPWRIMRIPIRDGTQATLVYGSYEKPPRRRTVRAADLPADDTEGNDLRTVRYIRLTTQQGSWSLDCWPRGAMGYVPADAAGLVRCMVVRPVPGALELWAVLSQPRAAYPAHMREKFILYADGRDYADVHPFDAMNYRFAFEKVVRLDFSGMPPPKKPKGHVPCGTEPYNEGRGYGWVSDPDTLRLVRHAPDMALVGTRVESDSPGQFRIDLPPGHYYLTLNIGSADAPTGPMNVTVNGKRELSAFRLDKGRFSSEVVWITSSRAHLDLEFACSGRGSWGVNALSVSSLGTLNEDFVLTRPWWHFEH